MKNAKEEFIGSNTLEELFKAMKCASLCFNDYDFNNYGENERDTRIVLKVGYTMEDLQSFLVELDFDYDSGYGTQRLHGLVLNHNGSYFTRGEYDGSEWWDYHNTPEVPEECL